MIDPLDIQLARHLAEIDASEARNELINRRAAELMLEDYSPKKPENIAEAIGNTTTLNQKLFAALVNNNDPTLASFVQDLSHEYWCELATQRAEIEWQRR